MNTLTGRVRLATLFVVVSAIVAHGYGCGGDSAAPGQPEQANIEQADEPDSPPDRADSRPTKPSATQDVSAPFDVATAINQVQNAYRPEDDAYVGGRKGFEVRVEGGSFTFAPEHVPDGVPLGEKSAQPPHREATDREATDREATGKPPQPSQQPETIEAAPAVFSTTVVQRSDQNFAADPTSRLGEDGHLELVREEFVEHLHNSAEGVEQSWEFASEPTGTGDLAVRVDVQGQEYAGETDGGLHFVDPDTGVGVRYGHGTWIDADGQHRPIEATWTGEAIELRVPAQVVESSSYPAVLDPIISPEYGMDDPVWVASEEYQQAPEVAFDGTNFMVVWDDARDSGEIYGARFDASGALLDDSGIPIAPGDARAERPAISFNGTDYLVAWTGERNDNTDVYATRIDPSGTVLDPDGIAISAGPEMEEDVTVTTDGTNFLVAWSDVRGANFNIYAARVDPAGDVLDTDGIALSDNDVFETNPQAAFDGTNFLVVWSRDNNNTYSIRGARVDTSGTVLDADPIAIHTGSGYYSVPTLAFDDSNYLVAWSVYEDGDDAIKGTLVDPSGTVFDPEGFSIATTSEGEDWPAVSSNGSGFLVAWTTGPYASTDIYATRVDASGNVVDTDGIAVSTASEAQSHPAIVSDGTDYLVAWEDARGPSMEIFAARVDASGSVLDPDGVLASRASNIQTNPAIASDGTNFLVAWMDRRNSDEDIFATRVSPSGTVLDPSGIAVSTAGGDQSRPRVAFNGTDYLVVWSDNRQDSSGVYATRVDTSGTVLDPDGTAVSTADSYYSTISVASDGADFLVVYSRGWDDHLYGTRVGNSGAVLGSELPIHFDNATTPAVAFDGTNYLVVWRDGLAGSSDIYGARIEPDGNLLDPDGFAISAGDSNDATPSVAYNGSHSLVAWHDFSDDGSDIYGVRVDDAGTVMDSTEIAIAATDTDKRSPAVASDGEDFVIAWTDYRNAGEESWYNSDVYGARLASDGSMLDADFAIAVEDGELRMPAVASSEPRTFFVSYLTSEPREGNTLRIAARSLLFNAPPEAADQNQTTDEDIPLTITLSATDADGHSLTYTLTSEPDSGDLSGTPPNLTYTPDPNYFGQDSLSFFANDGTDDSNEATVTIDVEAVNDTPSITTTAPTAATEDIPYEYAAAATDIEDDALSWAPAASDDCGGSIDASGTYAFTPAGPTPPAQCTLAIEVCDDGSPQECDTEAATVSIEAVNDAPSITSTAPTTATEDEQFEYVATAGDPEDDTLSWMVTQDDDCGGAIGATGTYTFTPAGPVPPADCTLSITTCDDGSPRECDTETATVSIEAVNDAPAFVAPTPADQETLTVDDGDLLTMELAADDPESGSITYDISPLPDDATFDATTGEFEWTPTWRDGGEHVLTLAASDGDLDAEREVTVEVSVIDEDDDGLPDNWERDNGLDPTTADSDDDNISDADEVGDDLDAPVNTDDDGDVDALEADSDGDGIPDVDEAGDDDLDTAPIDTDDDGTPDYRDTDSDDDSVDDGDDNCVLVENPDQTDTDDDGTGDACTDDADGDDVPDEDDNCPLVDNSDQLDTDDDGTGDACSDDDDGDEVSDEDDNCPLVDNPDQTDTDDDGTGDACTDDADGDGVVDADDVCPLEAGAADDGCPTSTTSAANSDDGCGCSSTSAPSSGLNVTLVLLGLLGVRFARRRSRKE